MSLDIQNVDIFNQHPQVFHYTNQAGLEGILSSQCLHATHYRYLNDTTEMSLLKVHLYEILFVNARRVLEAMRAQDKVMEKLIESSGGIDHCATNTVDSFISAVHGVALGENQQRSFFEPYVISFCAHEGDYEQGHGLLSQWRSYGRDSGYAFIFDTRKLHELFLQECKNFIYSIATFGDVVYNHQLLRMQQEFSKFLEIAPNIMRDLILGEANDLRNLFEAYTTSVCRFKHKAFAEEAEVRAVFSPMSQADVDQFMVEVADAENPLVDRRVKNPQFKPTLVPYIEINACSSNKLPISKIIVGPHHDKVHRADRLSRYLAKMRLDVEVIISETPFA